MKKYLLLTLLLLFIGMGLFYCIEIPSPPKALEKEARETLHRARSARAEQLTPTAFKKAELFFDSAMLQWRYENSKFILFRSYDSMEYYLSSVIAVANHATEQAASIKKQRKEKYESQLSDIEQLIERHEQYYSKLPTGSDDKQTLALIRLELGECRLSIKNKQLVDIEEKLSSIERKMSALNQQAEECMKSYFESFVIWEKLKNKALNASKKNKTNLLIVDKIGRQCHLFEKGLLQQSFPVELGSNWIGNKQFAGDKKTPEGMYKLVAKKEGKHTRFHQALLLDYPNTDDLRRHQMNIKKGIIPKNSQPGGQIEIHGMGGKGSDWTEGCVALTNDDMNILYKKVMVGTPVLIVGSLKPLHEVIAP